MSSPGWLQAWSDWVKLAASVDAEDDCDPAVSDDDDITGIVQASTGNQGDSKAALSALLQQLHEEQRVLLATVSPDQHFTKPPARYTEASMVKTLEEAGVGRPSTYAPTIRKLLVRWSRGRVDEYCVVLLSASCWFS